MLKSVHIKSYRSCNDVRLENVDNLLVLIGRNGAGKTNILKAIKWMAGKISTTLIQNSGEDIQPSSPGDIVATFQLDGLYEYKLTISHDYITSGEDGRLDISTTYLELLNKVENGKSVILFSRDGEQIKVPALQNQLFEISKNISAVGALQSLLPEENQFRQLLQNISKFFANVNYYPLELSEPKFKAPYIHHDTYQGWLHNKNKFDNPAQTLIAKILHLYLTNKDKYEELLSIVGEDGLGIISDINIREFNIPSPSGEDSSQKSTAKIYIFYFSPVGHESGAIFQLDDLSFGTKRILSFVVALLFDSASVALIEQIEDGVHEGMVDKLIPLIRGYAENSQFILASHSTSVFNRLEPDEVRIVELNKGITSVRALTAREVELAREYMKNDGPFSDFLQSI